MAYTDDIAACTANLNEIKAIIAAQGPGQTATSLTQYFDTLKLLLDALDARITAVE